MTGAMTAAGLLRVWVGLYLAAFYAYLFFPLAFMVGAAFNASSFPTVSPWTGVTLRWFGELFADLLLWRGIRNSLVIGAGVVLVSVPIGLAAALLLTRLSARARTVVYGVMVSPILTPGVIIGISTLVFWDRWFAVAGGPLLAVVAQSSFIAAYCMLLFMARLQRLDPTLGEAALDLGASHVQVFRKITLPFLRPAILSAALLSFLQSFENYNTTLFVIGTDTTMTIRIASSVRLGLTPAVNALAVLLIALTVLGAVGYEVIRRREQTRAAAARARARRAERETLDFAPAG